MNCTKNFLCIDTNTTQEDVIEWFAQNYSYGILSLYFNAPQEYQGRIILHVENAKEFAKKYSDRPFFVNQLRELMLRVSIVNIDDFPQEYKDKVFALLCVINQSMFATYSIMKVCATLGLKRHQLHDYFIFDEHTTIQEMRRLFAYDSRIIMLGHDLSQDYWYEIHIMNTGREWNEMIKDRFELIGLENVDKLILDIYPDEKSSFESMKNISVSEFCQEFGFQDELTKVSDKERMDKSQKSTTKPDENSTFDPLYNVSASEFCQELEFQDEFAKVSDNKRIDRSQKPTTKPDGTRICSWRSGKIHYGYFHLFGQEESGEKDCMKTMALIEDQDGSLFWMDPTRIKFV